MAPRAFLDYRVHSLEIISRGPVLTRTSKVFICHCLNSIHRIHRTRLIPISSIKGEVKKKHDAIGWISFCFAARVFEQELF